MATRLVRSVQRVHAMSQMAVDNLHNALSNLQVEVGREAPRSRHDVQLGIKELEVLRNVDLVAPPELAQSGEPLVEAFRGNITNGDHLRLPQLTHLPGDALRTSLRRVLSTDIDGPGGSPDARAAEAKMHRVLGAIEDALATIQAYASAQQSG